MKPTLKLPAPLRIPGLLALACGLLVACGGGGGGGGGDPSPPPNQAPVAAARLVGESVANAATLFDTTGTADSDGSISTRSWAYGDGQSGSVDNHIYATPGTYTAIYTVTDNRGATASATVAVTVRKCSAAGTEAARLSPSPTLCMQTTQGEMVLEVYPTQAPVTVANFLTYVDEGFYNGTLFHRSVANFVIQGGGYTPGPVAKTATHAAIALESNNGLQNFQYTLAMARLDTPTNSATSQFFINLVDNIRGTPNSLDYNPALGTPNGYAVFGQVISGTAVVDTLGRVATGSVPSAGLSNVPTQDIVIRSIVRMP